MTASNSPRSNRRLFLKLLGCGFPGVMILRTAVASGKTKLVRIAEFDASRAGTGVFEVEKIEKPKAEWKKQLTAEEFEVTRNAGTERPFTGKYASCAGGATLIWGHVFNDGLPRNHLRYFMNSAALTFVPLSK